MTEQVDEGPPDHADEEPSNHGDDLDELPDDLALDELQHQNTRRERSRWYMLTAWLVDHALLVFGVGGLVTFALLLVLGIEIPRWLRLSGFAALVSLILVGRPVGKKSKELLWNPATVTLVDIDALYSDGAVYRGPSQRWQQWKVTEGQPDWVSPSLAFVKEVDVETQTCKGTWRGTLNDRELMKALQQVYICREMLENDAKKGFAIDAQAWIIVRRATQNAVMSVIEAFEDGTLPDEGNGISEQIDQAIEQFDIENKIRRVDRDESPESDVPGVDELQDIEDLSLDNATENSLDRAAELARNGGDSSE
jgi:hypothetical protein